MHFIQSVNNFVNRATNNYYAESLEELNSFENVPVGSTGMVLTASGLEVYMYHSTLGWIKL